MAAPSVAPPSQAPMSQSPQSLAPFSRAPQSVAPISQFPGASSRKAPIKKKEPMSLASKMRLLGGLLLALLIGVAWVTWLNQRQSQEALSHQTAVSDMRLMAQRLGRSATLALAGQGAGFGQLRDTRDRFPEQLGSLGDHETQHQPVIEAWTHVTKDINTLLSQEKSLVALGKVAPVIDGQTTPLVDLSEQLLALVQKSGTRGKELEATTQLASLATRITRNAGLMLKADQARPAEVLGELGKDGEAMAKLMDALKNGSDAPRLGPLSQPDQRTVVLALDKAFQDYQGAASSLMVNLGALTTARQAGTRLQKGADGLLSSTEHLALGLQTNLTEQTPYGNIALGLTFLALLAALGMVSLYQRDVQQRYQDAKKQRQALEKANQQNQDAILRLMNELGNLADGDLTIQATVNEDITGAIADSVNYTVEEFRGTVQRINHAAEKVASASASAAQTSGQLLDAAHMQATHIQQAGASALEMAQSMNHVSADANRSAQVARKSLAVAQKGAQAVQDSMKGMNSIRDQIQETAKRIKRLGDSSLEIGEIVEMISDITEQTHVLALNAAIQAASAGEAGRGFTVVAEEVQRLAERSGDATQQIAAIVKTIQADTRNAVAAMERSTLDVVQGAKLSDAAGQALSEVGEVSSQMAALIDNISLATQKQSNTATQVAKRMKDILQITEQTTAGTQHTTQAVAQLDSLVAELKGSVAGFKVQ